MGNRIIRGKFAQVEQRWLKNDMDLNGDISPKSDRQTPDSDTTMDIEKCQKSISE